MHLLALEELQEKDKQNVSIHRIQTVSRERYVFEISIDFLWPMLLAAFLYPPMLLVPFFEGSFEMYAFEKSVIGRLSGLTV